MSCLPDISNNGLDISICYISTCILYDEREMPTLYFLPTFITPPGVNDFRLGTGVQFYNEITMSCVRGDGVQEKFGILNSEHAQKQLTSKTVKQLSYVMKQPMRCFGITKNGVYRD